MYYRTEQILGAYPQEFTGNSKGRGAILCTDSEGVYLLKEYTGSESRLEILEQVLNFLSENKILTEKLVRTSEGEVCYKDTDGSRYYMRTYFQGRECDTKNKDEILTVIHHMAKLHELLSGYDFAEQSFFEGTGDENQWARHTRELKKVRNYVRAKKKKNAFEEEFVKNYAHYMEQAERVLDLEKQTSVPEQARQLCHGDFNQHNLLFTKNGLAITGFERMRVDAAVSDLANFMRKILEKHSWNSGLGMDMFLAYNGQRQLEPWELQQLYMRLLYPEKFWKIVNHYYNARKTWVSGRNIEKLASLAAQEQKREEFLSMLFYLAK